MVAYVDKWLHAAMDSSIFAAGTWHLISHQRCNWYKHFWCRDLISHLSSTFTSVAYGKRISISFVNSCRCAAATSQIRIKDICIITDCFQVGSCRKEDVTICFRNAIHKVDKVNSDGLVKSPSKFLALFQGDLVGRIRLTVWKIPIVAPLAATNTEKVITSALITAGIANFLIVTATASLATENTFPGKKRMIIGVDRENLGDSFLMKRKERRVSKSKRGVYQSALLPTAHSHNAEKGRWLEHHHDSQVGCWKWIMHFFR